MWRRIDGWLGGDQVWDLERGQLAVDCADFVIEEG